MNGCLPTCNSAKVSKLNHFCYRISRLARCFGVVAVLLGANVLIPCCLHGGCGRSFAQLTRQAGRRNVVHWFRRVDRGTQGIFKSPRLYSHKVTPVTSCLT